MTGPAEVPSDAAVVAASLEDAQAFGAIFDRHADAVHGYLFRRGGRQVADDLTGEVFRIAFEQRRRFDLGRSSARPWLYGIAANLLRRHWRTRSRRGAAYRRLSARELVGSVDHLDAVDATMDAHRQAAALATALATLAPRDREPLLLHVWEELSYAEVAEVLGIPVGTVRSRLSRARRRLRASLLAQRVDAPAEPRRKAQLLDPGHP